MKSGKISTEEVPVPALKPGGILVENFYSVISAGTELGTIKLGQSSYLGKAKMKPDLFKKVLDVARKQGPLTAYQAVKGRLNTPLALGYSCAGKVLKASDDVPFKVGDRVACAGNTYAHHSDVVFVPKNLAVKIPDNVSLKDAAYTTIGSIAMQGVRNADVRLGEKVVVIGLGLIGQITVQILKASGCTVFGVDIDPAKIDLAKKNGLDAGGLRSHDTIEEQINAFTSGIGADSVIITAATSSNDPLDFAGKITRKKGRVVLVGAVGMEIPRDNYYLKEIEFVISCSYGPGRYDSNYEELGNDYPVGYVRWTERRNMESFLELIEQGKVKLDNISTHKFKIEDASKAYDIVKGEVKEPFLGIILSYGKKKELQEKLVLKKPAKTVKGNINIGMIGAGAFATSTLLHALKKVDGVNLVGLSAASGISSKASGENFGFEYATTDYKQLLKDDRIDGVVIATRNSLHATMTMEAMESGKHVFVEKPLAVSMEELKALIKAHKKYPDIVVNVGFNRRYAPFSKKIKNYFKDRKGPMVMIYRVNAEDLPGTHWAYEDREGGSRFNSELCHFIDFCKFIVGSDIESSQFFRTEHPSLNLKKSLENIVMNLKFKDGSTASIIYNTISDTATSKEYFEIYSENALIRVRDFRELMISKNGNTKTYKDRLKTEKGHFEELEDFIKNIRTGNNPFNEWIKTTKITLKR